MIWNLSPRRPYPSTAGEEVETVGGSRTRRRSVHSRGRSPSRRRRRDRVRPVRREATDARIERGAPGEDVGDPGQVALLVVVFREFLDTEVRDRDVDVDGRGVADRRDAEPIEPSNAQQLYLDHRASQCSDITVQSHEYQLNCLVTWCADNSLDNMNDGRNLHEYHLWREEEGELSKIPDTDTDEHAPCVTQLLWLG